MEENRNTSLGEFWKDGAEGKTPLSADNLNAREEKIKEEMDKSGAIIKGEGENSAQQITSNAIGKNAVALGNSTVTGKLLSYKVIAENAEAGTYTLESLEGYVDESNFTEVTSERWEAILTTKTQNFHSIPVMSIDVDNCIITIDPKNFVAFSEVNIEPSLITNLFVLRNSNGQLFGNIEIDNTTGDNQYSRVSGMHAEGEYSIAFGSGSHAEGEYSLALGVYSHAEGQGTTATGRGAHAEGRYTRALGHATHAEGDSCLANNSCSHVEGIDSKAIGVISHAEGQATTASGRATHAENYYTIASGSYSHAEGEYTEATGTGSHAEGQKTKAAGFYSHAEGQTSQATGFSAHAENHATASGSFSHAEGTATASGNYSHAEGNIAKAFGVGSHVEGLNTIAAGEYQHVQGKCNIEDTTSAFIIGNGTSAKRSNALTLDWNGNLKIAGDLQDMNGNSLLGSSGNNTAMPFYVGEAYVQLTGGRGEIDFHIEGLTEDDIDTEIEPLISTKYSVEIIKNGYGYSGFDTWYYSIELKTNNSWLSDSRVKVKFLLWKK